MILICAYCKQQFQAVRRTRKYCSHKCSTDANRGKQCSKRVMVACKTCEKPIIMTKRRMKTAKHHFCSLQCRFVGQIKHIKKACFVCGKEFEIHPSDMAKSMNGGSFCSQGCAKVFQSTRQTGKNNPCWKGGVTKEYTLIRTSPKAREWAKAIFQRDNFTCQKCGVRGNTLNAHHIKDFANHTELRFDINNGITLCEKCHREHHKFKGKPKRRSRLEFKTIINET